MNNVEYLISTIRREIPDEILQYGFCSPTALNVIRPNLGYLINNVIIKDWVLKDCNVVGGIEVTIGIASSKITAVNGGFIIEVPLAASNGKEINSVLSISHGYDVIGTNNTSGLLGSLLGPEATASARIEMIGPNTFFTEDSSITPGSSIRCTLEHTNNFNDIPSRALPVLAELCMLATKAYLYNSLIIKVNQAAIVNGVSLGVFADIIREYADSSTIYKDILQTKWRGISIMMDRVSHNRLIRMQI